MDRSSTPAGRDAPDDLDDRAWAVPWTHAAGRLHIAPCDVDAAQALARLAADPRVAGSFWVGQPQPDAEPGRVRYWLQEPADRVLMGRLSLAVREQAGAPPVGGIQLASDGLCYLVDPRRWGEGFGGEMLQACCRLFPPRLGMTILRATVLRDNLRSRRVLESAGFAYDGQVTRAFPGRAGEATLLRYRRDCGEAAGTG